MKNLSNDIRELRAEGFQLLPLNTRSNSENGKIEFIHPFYSDRYDKSFTDDEIEKLLDAGYNKGIGLIHGKCQPHLKALDFDEKNAKGKNLYQTWSNIIDPDIFRKLVIEKTRSAGYHVYFNCKAQAPEKALASSGTGDEWIALRSSKSNGITYCAPSPGYDYLQGSLFDIEELTAEEMQQLCDAAQQLNEFFGHKVGKGAVLPVVQSPAAMAPAFREFDRLTSPDFIPDFLQSVGWTIDGNIRSKMVNGEKWEYIKMWRPGRGTGDPASANYWLKSKRLSVFTSSTPLPAFDSGMSFSHLPSRVLYYLNDQDWRYVYDMIVKTAEEKAIELPKITPMAYSVVTRGGEVWKVEVKGIIDWAESCGYQWMKFGSQEDATEQLIRVAENVIYICNENDIVRHYREEVERNYQGEQSSRVLLAFLPSIMRYMTSLPRFDQELMRDEAAASYIYLQNGALKVSKEGASLVPYNQLQACVFGRHIKDIRWKEMEGTGEFGQFIDNISIDADHKKYIMSAIGYALHHYKLRNFAKALMIIEDVEDQEEARGRSGKGLIAQFIEWIRWSVQQDGRNYKSDSQFKMQQIVPGVQVFYLNDPAPNVLMNQFYNFITDDWLVESKGKKSYTIPFKHSPKILITTNYLPNLESDSDKDRFIVLPIKKHYGSHRSIRDDFPDTIFFSDDWSEEKKIEALNFAVQCIQLYLSHGVLKYTSEATERNANMRLIKNLVPESIIETMEQGIECAKVAKDRNIFFDMLRPYDLKRDTSESLAKAFEYEDGNLVIFVSSLYQYVMKAYNSKNMVDKVFGKRLRTYIEKSGYRKISEMRSNTKGVKITISVTKINDLEDAPF